MSDKTRFLARSIEKSKSEVTVLFTDIVNSTAFWDKHGDTAGRLMLDLHNNLLFPVVRAFRGTVIKTIGDSIMASFKSPKNGVRAAIAMQQTLKRHRRENKDFDIHIRIGVHTGSAIVEANDVYGDMVNVAARVESAAGKDEILVSKTTASQLLRRKAVFGLSKTKSFVPKGKTKSMTVWVCDWRSLDDVTGHIRRSSLLPPNRRQLVELGVYLTVTGVSVYFLYILFIRFLLADFELLALYLVTPPPWVIGLLLVIAATGLVFFVRSMLRRNQMPVRLFRFIKGSAAFGVVLFLFLGVFQWLNLGIKPYWNKVVYKPDNAFTEVVGEGVGIRGKPVKKSPVIADAVTGGLYIHRGTVQKAKLNWDKVLIRHATLRYGYILQRLPPKIGVPAVQLTEKKNFVIRYYHLYAFGLALVGFLWGVLSFRLRPL